MITARKHHDQTLKQDKKKEQGQERPIVEIQFCTNCDAHLFAVRHQQAKYSLHYQNIKKRLMESKIAVRKRAVPQILYKKSPYCPSNVYYRQDNNQIVYFPEIGSFEAYFNGRKIFSKLQSLKWPTPESIISEIEKAMSEKKEDSTEMHPQKQQNSLEHENKKGEFRIKNKNDEHLHFRYSIDKRNLFKKPDNNYLNRKSLTARNQSNHQSVNLKNNLNSSEKRVNEEELPPTEGRNRKDISDDFVIQMYQKKQSKVEEKPEENALNFPQIPKKNRRKSGGTNVYLQPIFPKTSVNLQSYSRQRAILATKIHQQRKSYEASKNQPKTKPEADMTREISKARFNEDCNNLFKDKQAIVAKDLKKIKEATEENEVKSKQYKIQIVQAAQKVREVPVVAAKKSIEQSNELMPPSEPQKSIHTKAPEKKDEKLKEQADKQMEQEIKSNSEQVQAQKQGEKIHESPHAQPDANLQTTKEKNAILHIDPSNVDIDKIATSKAINEIDKSKMKSQEIAYEEQFEQEEVHKETEKQEGNHEKEQVEIIAQSKVKQPEGSKKEKQNEAEYEDQQFQEEKEKVEKQIQQAEVLAQMINEQVEQIVGTAS